MSASNTDKFKKLTNNFSTTLNGAIVGTSDTSMTLASTTNLPTDTGVVLVIDRVNSSGTATPSTREYVKGTVSGSTIINLVRGLGNSTAQAHSSGAVVEQVVDQTTINDLMDGILAQHNQDGTHNAVTANSLTVSSQTWSSLASGWFEAAQTWTYSSYDSTNKTGVINVPSDATAKYSAGVRVRFTNNSATQYGIITAVSSSTITVYFGTDYSLTNATISSPYYSFQKAPYAFPMDPSKWTVSTAITTATSATITAGTWVSPGPTSMTLPIGAWVVSFSGQMWQTNSSAGGFFPRGGLSTSNNSVSDNDLIVNSWIRVSATSQGIIPFSMMPKIFNVSTATTLNWIFTVEAGGGTITGGFYGNTSGSNYGATISKAVCAYL